MVKSRAFYYYWILGNVGKIWPMSLIETFVRIVILRLTEPSLHWNHPSPFLKKMRAVLIKDGKGPVENLYIGEAPKPTLGKGDVLVKESPIRWKIYNLEIEPSF